MIDNKCFGRNHCGIVNSNGCVGDIHFNEMTEDEIYSRLKSDYEMFSRWNRPAINAKDSSHLAEYRVLGRFNKVKTIGYITKDKVVFEGKEYNFNRGE